jgi:hypothetical protein
MKDSTRNEVEQLIKDSLCRLKINITTKNEPGYDMGEPKVMRVTVTIEHEEYGKIAESYDTISQ